MEKNRSAKVIAIVALLVAVAGVSVGFAAFSNTLTITADGHYHADKNNFDVNFVPTANDSGITSTELSVAPKASGLPSGASVTATDATLDNSNLGQSVIKGIHVDFHNPGESFTYDFVIKNEGKYVAYLKSVVLGAKTCSAITGTNVADTDEANTNPDHVMNAGVTESLMAEACKDIHYELTIDGTTYKDEGVKTITDNTIEAGKSATASLKIYYEKKAEGFQVIADGDFAVSFADSTVSYGSAK